AKLALIITSIGVAALSFSLQLRSAERGSAPAYRYFRAGNSRDIHPATHAGYALIGGGQDLDEAFNWLCGRSGGGDLLILRAAGTDAYNPYIQSLCHENSVATLIIPSRDAAEDPFVAQTIRDASAIFIAGGDQANYINFWSGTGTQRALNAAIRSGIPIGGTSAGLAVLGQFVYSAQHDLPDGPNLNSHAALSNPFEPQVVIVRDFLHIPVLHGVITDTHFHARDRLGRLLVFMARILESRNSSKIHAIGVDQHTAFLLEPDGAGVVAGSGAAYFFEAAYKPVKCKPGEALTFNDVSVHKLLAGDKFNITLWTGEGTSYTISATAGVLRSTQPGGSIY
ncbi:MAG TPA: cyanophycinase, partial [Verrucomicrobiae bacterium]|nr:cyanophycinase [Verrucomicrobiae bacterium]